MTEKDTQICTDQEPRTPGTTYYKGNELNSVTSGFCLRSSRHFKGKSTVKMYLCNGLSHLT